MAKPKEVSLETPPKTELPKVELPKNENKLLDEDDELGTSTVPDLSVASEEEKEISLTTVWDHAIDTLFKLSTIHPDGRSVKKLVQQQNIDSIEQVFEWDERQLAVPEHSTSYLDTLWDKTSLEYLNTNPRKNLLMLGNTCATLWRPNLYPERTLARSLGKSS